MKRWSTQRIKKDGFTVVELIVVISIVAILLGVMTVSITDVNSDVRLSNAANRAMADVRYAHEMALAHRKEVDVIVTPASNRYEIKWHDDGSYLVSSNDDNDLIVNFSQGDYSDVTIASTGIGSRLSFTSTGQPLINGTVFSGDRSVMLLNSRVHVVINDAGLTYLNTVLGGSGCAGGC